MVEVIVLLNSETITIIRNLNFAVSSTVVLCIWGKFELTSHNYKFLIAVLWQRRVIVPPDVNVT